MKSTNIAPLLALSLIVCSALGPVAKAADEPAVRRGTVQFQPVADEEHQVPAPFRLPAKSFEFEQTAPQVLSDGVAMSLVTFPSPVVTTEKNNNTVHCEYFRPAKPGRYPACVVLHILGGDFPLARMFANHLAQHGVAALFVKMPYYGERRQPGSAARMISTNPTETVNGMTQAVKDIRYAAAWLAAQDEVDPQQLGIFGISLGGITASLAAAAEPRFTKVCPVLAGGDFSQVMEGSTEPHLKAAREHWLADGHTLAELAVVMKPIDPCTHCHPIAGRKVLMINATNDEVIPRACTDRLWQSFGQPEIVWYNCGHYSAILHVLDALDQVGNFFGGTGERPAQKSTGTSATVPR